MLSSLADANLGLNRVPHCPELQLYADTVVPNRLPSGV